MDEETLRARAETFLDAWNRQDVEAVLECYTEPLVYRDPNTRGEIRKRDDFRRYLRKLFAAWQMEWHLREEVPARDFDGGAVLWRVVISKAGESEKVEIDGMDLIVWEGDKVCRNEVYFDRARLAALMT
jgi:ketosteroid isomerase-like protein